MKVTLGQPPDTTDDRARDQSFPSFNDGEARRLSFHSGSTSLESRKRQASESQSSRLASSHIGALAVERELLAQELSQLRAEMMSLRECVVLLSSECKHSFQKLEKGDAAAEGELDNLPQKNKKKRKRTRKKKKQQVAWEQTSYNMHQQEAAWCNNSLGTDSSLGTITEEESTTSFDQEQWMILVDTGAELSVAPRGFAAQLQLDPLEGTELRTADGRAIKTFGRKTVELTTLGFSFTMPFVIADVETPLLGFSSMLEQNLCLHMDGQLGHSLVNTHGEKTQLQQQGHQLFLAAWLSPLAVNSSLVGFVFSSFSLGLSEHKEVHKTGGADLGSFTSDNLEHLRQHKNTPAIGQQTALPEDWRTQKKQCKTKVGNKLRNKKQLEYMKMMQLDLLDPTRSLEQQTSRDLSLRVILTLSLMHRWQLSTARFQTACLQHLRNGHLKELGLIQSKTSFEIFVGEELCVMMDGPSLLIGGEQSVQESFLAKLSARYPLDNTRKLEQNTPLTFLGRILEYSQADRSISLSLPRAFYAELLARYSLEDATTRATPKQLVQQAPSWTHTSLDASKTKLYKRTVGELSGASLLRPDIAYAVQNLSLSLQHPTTKEEDELKNLLRYLKGTQQYRVSLQPPRRWKQRGHLELLAFSSISWHKRACGFIVGSSLSLFGVHLAAFTTSQATSMTTAEFDSVSLACTLALHTQNLLKELGLTKPVSLRLLSGGSVARQLGLSNSNRHVDLWCRLGKFQLSKARAHQNLAEELTQNLSTGGLHKLLSKLRLHTQTVEMQALTTELSREQLASFQSSLSSFYIGVVSRTPMMEQQLSESPA